MLTRQRVQQKELEDVNHKLVMKRQEGESKESQHDMTVDFLVRERVFHEDKDLLGEGTDITQSPVRDGRS